MLHYCLKIDWWYIVFKFIDIFVLIYISYTWLFLMVSPCSIVWLNNKQMWIQSFLLRMRKLLCWSINASIFVTFSTFKNYNSSPSSINFWFYVSTILWNVTYNSRSLSLSFLILKNLINSKKSEMSTLMRSVV